MSQAQNLESLLVSLFVLKLNFKTPLSPQTCIQILITSYYLSSLRFLLDFKKDYLKIYHLIITFILSIYVISSSFLNIQPVQFQSISGSEGSIFGLMIYHLYLEIIYNFIFKFVFCNCSSVEERSMHISREASAICVFAAIT